MKSEHVLHVYQYRGTSSGVIGNPYSLSYSEAKLLRAVSQYITWNICVCGLPTHKQLGLGIVHLAESRLYDCC